MSFVKKTHLLVCVLAALSSCMCRGYGDEQPLSDSSPPDSSERSMEKSDLRNYQTVWQKFRDQTPADRDAFLSDSFPDGFQWATSTESFKVEGAWAVGGKGETIWDRFGHEGHAADKVSADLACDSYYKVDYEVYLMRGLQVNTFQFSISWARIFPSGYKDSVSQDGVSYYNGLIDALIDSGIQPVATLYHWDLPQVLQDRGGWTDASIVQAFKEYADFCFLTFGDRVKTWNTFSSPWVVSHAGYGTGEHAPRVQDYVVSSYQVTHNILKSHAEAWHVYNDKYRNTQGGQVGIALNSDWAEPTNPSSAADVAAAERYIQFMLGWFAHPIFVDGDYPSILKTQIEQKRTDCPSSVPATLPVFTAEEKTRIRGTADFFGLNHYTSRLVANTNGGCSPGPSGVGNFNPTVDPSWPTTASDWLSSAPWGLRRLLNFISTEYLQTTNVPIYITGNGMSTESTGDVFNDNNRVTYLRSYINEALKAIKTDNINVQRFTVQSLLDGFEGPQGYTERFGLHFVNFDMADKPRTPRQSAYFYSEVIENNGFAPRSTIVHSSPGKIMQSNKVGPLPPSTVPSSAKDVWTRFTGQSVLERKEYHYGTFPEGFTWGVSTSAYQIEGGYNADGKGPSIWDTFTNTPGSTIPEDATGNIACDSYNRYNEDLYMLRGLSVNSYRFSISWSRIFPDGRRTSLNQEGVNYYNRLIDGLLASNIAPIVTLYHWDLPQALQDIGGWESNEMINIFNDYCDFCFATFGDRVKFWMTFNQPYTIAWSGYGNGHIPPRKSVPATLPYQVAHNLIKAHATAYHTYDDKYRASQGGKVSIALNADWFEPTDVHAYREIDAADRAMQFHLGWFAHPIFKNGDYPEAMKWQVGNKSEITGLSESRLPSFTEEEKNLIKGTADMFCANHYTTRLAGHIITPHTPASMENDWDFELSEMLDQPTTPIQGVRAVSHGLRRLLNWIKEEYGNPEIYITENGDASNVVTTVDDPDRNFFFKTYIDEALKAHDLDGVNVKGYIATTLMDSFEWMRGYQQWYGLYYVNHNIDSRPRTPKRSAHLYAQIVRDNGFPLPEEEKFLYGEFPDFFRWSSASSAYQIEGSWRTHGKGLSIWDEYAHTPWKIGNMDTGDLACDSYNKIDEDVAVLSSLKVPYYRFSISWPRVLPDGTNSYINEDGLNYYSRLIDALLAANIQPQVTLNHWDLPSALQRVGGWENETIVQRFRDYADVLFKRLGPRVKFWITHNEPYIIANLGYGYGSFAPAIVNKQYIVTHNLLKAHAEAWHLYNDNYRATQNGLISITLNSDWAEPRNKYKHEDHAAANRYMQFFVGWFAHPIFVGDYPEVMKTTIRERSLAAGFAESRLPEFTPAEIQRIKGTHDYFGLNHYTSVLAFHIDTSPEQQDYEGDKSVAVISDRTWLETGSDWLRITPFGFRKLLKFIKDEYGNPPIYVTENGVSERGEVDLNDAPRTYYYRNYINNALRARVLDGADVRGYTAWSLMDNFEWAAGYAERFGLFYVNRSDPNLPRIPKVSAGEFSKIVSCNGFPDPALGPHECLTSDATPPPPATTPRPGGTTPPSGVTTPPSGGTTPPSGGTTPPSGGTTTGRPGGSVQVSFLGLDLVAEDAEVALYVLFAFVLVGALSIIFAVYVIFTSRKKVKKATQNYKMERM